MSKVVFVIANILFRYFYPVYRFAYYHFKRKQDVHEISILKRFIKQGDRVLDIGANVGFYSELIAELVGSAGEVHAFEPDPVNFRHLLQSVGTKKNIYVNNMAVSSEPGELKLYTSRLLNVDHRSYPIDDFGESFVVKAESIDNYIQDKKVSFIKMDIQGAELFALKGMTQTLDRNSDIILICEFWPYGLKNAGCSVEDFQKMIQDKGFLFYLVQDDKLIKLNDLMDYRYRPEKEYFNLVLSRKEIN